jgi:hypothetical protein
MSSSHRAKEESKPEQKACETCEEEVKTRKGKGQSGISANVVKGRGKKYFLEIDCQFVFFFCTMRC